MPKGTLIPQLPCVSWLIGCAILGISEILAARRGYAQGSISTLIWPTATGGFLSLVSLLAIWMLGRFRSVEIQARRRSPRVSMAKAGAGCITSASPTDLAEHTGLSTGATTAMIDRLENAGLVVRRPHPTDRRGTIVVLSKEAMRKLPAMFASLAEAMDALVSTYSEKELKVLADFFAKVGVLWKEEREKLQG